MLSLLLVSSVIAASTTCNEYYHEKQIFSGSARAWCQAGDYYQYEATKNYNYTVNIFYRCSGNKTNPAIVMMHGWPTSSYDF